MGGERERGEFFSADPTAFGRDMGMVGMVGLGFKSKRRPRSFSVHET